ncbi:MAG: twin-arginine translocation pathway signal [Burkholderiales bacterium]|nr:twin-arginine translocation pathway signal [Burkholderiales bacterium]
MMIRRLFLGLSAAAVLVVAGCATPGTPSLDEAPPIVFVHGNGDTAALWQTTLWRFESNGWPRERLHAIDAPYPLARDDDTKPQPGRTSAAEHMAYLKAEVEKVLAATGAKKVVLMGNSRGGNAIRNYIQNGGGDRTVSHAILGGTPNHGVQAIKGLNEGNEFSGTGPFLMSLNAPKNAAGDEVAGPVKWLTVRSDSNDKFAQPEGQWIGMRGKETNVTFAGPELKGATNVVVPRLDHRETSYSPAAFEAAYRFITGRAPATTTPAVQEPVVLSGKIAGLGVNVSDPKTGNFSNNLPIPGAVLDIYAVDATTGARTGPAVYSRTVSPDGMWGPFTAQSAARYEFVVTAPGYATTHIYRSPFPRSSSIVNLRAERIADADKDAGAVVTLVRPRGYLDPVRDKMVFDGQSPPPGALPGAGVASSKIKLAVGPDRPVSGEFNGERVTGRAWPAAGDHVSVLELTY